MILNMKLAAVVVLFAGAIGATAADKAPAAQFDDTAFVKMAAICSIYEVELGKIAAPQAKDDDVKKLAELMVKDHTAVNAELKAAAKAADIGVPDRIDDAHQTRYEAFKAYKGDNFDRDYVKDVVKTHTEGVALFTQASKEAKNKDLKDFAIKTLPALQKHLDAAKKLEK